MCLIENCETKSFGDYCFRHKPKKPMRVNRRMKPVGKVGKATMQSNKEFLDSKRDDELYCFYCVYIGAGWLMPRKYARAEHYYSRARHPELRLDNSKKVISCDYHNKDKGSLDGDEYLKILDERIANEKTINR
jgi:hypothetical protein